MTVAFGVLAILILGAGYDFWKRVNRRFRTVHRGRFYKSGVMPMPMLERRIRRLKLKTVIDLRDKQWTREEEETVRRCGAQYVHIPSEQIPSQEAISRFLEVIDDRASLPALVHCHHGRGRANYFTAIYRIEHMGWSPEKARCNVRLFACFGSFAKRKPRGKALTGYVPVRSNA